MRLWHIKLISALPKAQLVAQWRECSAIAKAIKDNGTPNHILVNFVIEYPVDHLINYSLLIREEMTKRGYRTMQSVEDKIVSLNPEYKKMKTEDIYPKKMDDTYLKICLYNLYEKYLCGGISQEEFDEIQEVANKNF